MYLKSTGTLLLLNALGLLNKTLYYFFLLIVLGRGVRGEVNIDLLFHLFMHSLVAACMYVPCPGIDPATLVCWDRVLIN